jgi:hypothetical protein
MKSFAVALLAAAAAAQTIYAPLPIPTPSESDIVSISVSIDYSIIRYVPGHARVCAEYDRRQHCVGNGAGRLQGGPSDSIPNDIPLRDHTK